MDIRAHEKKRHVIHQKMKSCANQLTYLFWRTLSFLGRILWSVLCIFFENLEELFVAFLMGECIIENSRQRKLRILSIILTYVATFVGFFSLAWSENFSHMLSWLTSEKISDRRFESRGTSNAEVTVFLVFILCYGIIPTMFQSFFKFVDSRNPATFRFVIRVFLPCVSILATQCCGDDQPLFIAFLMLGSSCLFSFFATRPPEYLSMTELLVSLNVAFLVYFRQILVITTLIALFFADSWIKSSSLMETKSRTSPSRPMHDIYEKFQRQGSGPWKLGYVFDSSFFGEHVLEIFNFQKHDVILTIQDGHGILDVEKSGTIFRLHDKVLPIVCLIIYWIFKESLAETFPVIVVYDAEFLSQDLDLLVREGLGILHLRRCGVRLFIGGDNSLSLLLFMKSLGLRYSSPRLLQSAATFCATPLCLCYPSTFVNGSKVVRLRKKMFEDLQNCLKKEMLSRFDAMKFQQVLQMKNANGSLVSLRKHDLHVRQLQSDIEEQKHQLEAAHAKIEVQESNIEAHELMINAQQKQLNMLIKFAMQFGMVLPPSDEGDDISNTP